MTCDHKATRSSLPVFKDSTDRRYYLEEYVNEDGSVGLGLYGNCRHCGSTIGIAIQEIRASVVSSGTIEPGAIPQPRPCTRTNWCGGEDGHEGDCYPPF